VLLDLGAVFQPLPGPDEWHGGGGGPESSSTARQPVRKSQSPDPPGRASTADWQDRGFSKLRAATGGAAKASSAAAALFWLDKVTYTIDGWPVDGRGVGVELGCYLELIPRQGRGEVGVPKKKSIRGAARNLGGGFDFPAATPTKQVYQREPTPGHAERGRRESTPWGREWVSAGRCLPVYPRQGVMVLLA